MAGIMKVPYAQSIHGRAEMDNVWRAIQQNRLAPGPDVLEFERRVAALFGKDHGIMVNSGSSANLLALELLDLPEGSEIITPALTFATVVAPILQKKLKPVFVDVEPGKYIPSIHAIEAALTSDTMAIMIPSLIGNVPDLRELSWLAEDEEVYFVEDSCDTIGATFADEPTGNFSDISTTSFYGSHIITAGGGGGMLCVNDDYWADKARVLRGWGRSSATFGESEDLDKRFATRLDGLDYDAKFIFNEVGYNMQSTELCAAFGLAQLDRLPTFTKQRYQNFNRLFRFFQQYQDLFILPRQTPHTTTNWLAFPLTVKTDRFTRREITMYLEEHGIMTRPIFTGNILRQPAFQGIAEGQFPVADNIMENAFLIGCHQGLSDEQLTYVEDTVKKFLTK